MSPVIVVSAGRLSFSSADGSLNSTWTRYWYYKSAFLLMKLFKLDQHQCRSLQDAKYFMTHPLRMQRSLSSEAFTSLVDRLRVFRSWNSETNHIFYWNVRVRAVWTTVTVDVLKAVLMRIQVFWYMTTHGKKISNVRSSQYWYLTHICAVSPGIPNASSCSQQ